jgi:hypothetical protein
MLTDAATNDADPTPDVSPASKPWTEQDIQVLLDVFKTDQSVDELGAAFHARASVKRSYAAMARQLTKLSKEETKDLSPTMMRKVMTHAQLLLRLHKRGEIDTEMKGVRYINARRAYSLYGMNSKRLSDANKYQTRIRRKKHVTGNWVYSHNDIVSYLASKPKREPVAEYKKPGPKPKNLHTNGHANGHTNGYSNGNGTAHTAPRIIKPKQVPDTQRTRDVELRQAAEYAIEKGLLTPGEAIEHVIRKLRVPS